MRLTLAVALLALARMAFAAGEVSVGTGINYTTGTYGGSNSTSIVTIPVIARYEGDAWSFRATVPYLRISGPRAVIPGVGRVDNGNAIDDLLHLTGSQRGRSQTDSRTVSGMGDSTLSATYTMYSGSASRSGVGLTGKVKLATGDEKQGLGTGSNDFSAQVDAFQQIDRNTLFGVIGYTIFGDSPIVEFQNVANIGVGASRRMDGGDSVGVAFDARQSGNPAPAPQRELTAFWTHKLEGNWRTQAYFLKGFANGSPDWGLGLNASVAF
jgi:hypothetical protein